MGGGWWVWLWDWVSGVGCRVSGVGQVTRVFYLSLELASHIEKIYKCWYGLCARVWVPATGAASNPWMLWIGARGQPRESTDQ